MKFHILTYLINKFYPRKNPEYTEQVEILVYNDSNWLYKMNFPYIEDIEFEEI